MTDAGIKDAKLKLEAGKKYVDRRGRVFGPMLPISTISTYFQDSEGAVWDGSGKLGGRLDPPCSMDLVAEYQDPKPAEPTQASLHDECDCCGASCECGVPYCCDAFTIEFIDPNEPQRGQFWAYNANRKCCVFMIGKNLNGHWVAVDRNGEYEVFSGRGNMDLKFWHHEPGFEGFDGPVDGPVEPAPETPSSPAEPLPAELWETQDRAPIRIGIDQFRYGKNPWRTSAALHYFQGHEHHGWVHPVTGDTLELRCYRSYLPGKEWPPVEVLVDKEEIDEPAIDPVYDPETFTSDWGPFPSDKVQQQPEVWPKWLIPSEIVLSMRETKQIAFVRRDNERSGETFHVDGTSFTFSDFTNDPRFREVTETEALARVTPKAAPLPALIPGIATDRMVDLFLSWRLPSDFRPDGGISFTSRPAHESWPTGTNLFTSSQARKMIEYLLSVPEDTARVTPAEVFPDPGEGWELLPVGTVVENGDHYLTPSGVWLATGAVGFKAGSNEAPSFYRRKIKPTEVWPKWYVRTSGADSWVYRADDLWTIRNLTCDCLASPPEWYWRHGNMVEITEAEALARVTPVESPDDWVTQDRCDFRPELDEYRWRVNANHSTSWTARTNLNARHGQEIAGAVAEVRCRRKDLPLMPLPPAKPEIPAKPKVRTIKLIRWIVWEDIGSEEEIWSADKPSCFENAYDTGDFKLQQLPVFFK